MGCSGADEIRESIECRQRGQQQRASHCRVKGGVGKWHSLMANTT